MDRCEHNNYCWAGSFWVVIGAVAATSCVTVAVTDAVAADCFGCIDEATGAAFVVCDVAELVEAVVVLIAAKEGLAVVAAPLALVVVVVLFPLALVVAALVALVVAAVPAFVVLLDFAAALFDLDPLVPLEPTVLLPL